MSMNTSTDIEEVTFQFVPGAVKEATKGMKSADLWKVPVDRLRIKADFNPRVMTPTYKERIRYICESIKSNGFYADQPLAGYVARENNESVVIVTNGHTRYAALKLAIEEGAQIEVVPVVTKPNGTSMEDLTVGLVTSNSGAPLTPYETAVVCKRLINYGMTEAEIAARLVFSTTQVKNYLLLMAAPREVRQLVIDEKVSATLAIETLRKHGADAATVLQNGLASAEGSGKTRATRKDMGAGGTAKAPRISRSHVLRSVSYVVENKLDKDERILQLLAFLAGSTVEDVRKLIDQPKDNSADENASTPDTSNA